MPVLIVEIVESPGWVAPPDLARRIANAVASALSSSPQSVWVRLNTIAAANYAENGGQPADAAPVFVTIIEREPPQGEGLEREIAALTGAVAAATSRSRSSIHLIYEPPARGRIAFGGRLVT